MILLTKTMGKNRVVLNCRIEHTILKHNINFDQIKRELAFVEKHGLRSIVVPSSIVNQIRSNSDFNHIKVVTVSDFPFGFSDLEIKLEEINRLFILGADEVDFVVNYSHILSDRFNLLDEELKEIRKISRDSVVKGIAEISELTIEQTIKTAELFINNGINYFKTSTGFSKSGANSLVIRELKNYFGNNIKIKASGGLKTYKDVMEMIDSGAELIGTSSSKEIIKLSWYNNFMRLLKG